MLVRKGVHIPAIRDHQVVVTFIALLLVVGGLAVGVGFINLSPNTTSTQQIATSQYSLTATLGNIQGASAATNAATTVILASKLTTINGVNGIETTANLYNGGDFLVAGDHNATVGQAQFSVTMYRTDTLISNISFSASASGIPSLTNTTSAKVYLLVVQTSTNQYEVYFANNTQTPNIYVHVIAIGGQVTFWVTINYNVNAVQVMTVYQSESFNLNVNFGVGQSLGIPIELIRAA